MDIEIHKHGKTRDAYAAVAKGNASALPKGPWKKVRDLTINPGDKPIGMDVTEAIKQIGANGVYVFGAGTFFTEK